MKLSICLNFIIITEENETWRASPVFPLSPHPLSLFLKPDLQAASNQSSEQLFALF